LDSFSTKRLLVRPLSWGDLNDLQALYGDREVMRFVTGRARSLSETRERLQKHIRDHETYGFGLCAVLDKKTKRMIGRCGIQPVPTPQGLEGEAVWLFAKEFWGQGYGTEFGRAMVPKAFGGVRLRRIFARADSDNVGSIRVIQKSGMRLVGEVPGEGVEYEIQNP